LDLLGSSFHAASTLVNKRVDVRIQSPAYAGSERHRKTKITQSTNATAASVKPPIIRISGSFEISTGGASGTGDGFGNDGAAAAGNVSFGG
jgi:hypothetical protein